MKKLLSSLFSLVFGLVANSRADIIQSVAIKEPYACQRWMGGLASAFNFAPDAKIKNVYLPVLPDLHWSYEADKIMSPSNAAISKKAQLSLGDGVTLWFENETEGSQKITHLKRTLKDGTITGDLKIETVGSSSERLRSVLQSAKRNVPTGAMDGDAWTWSSASDELIDVATFPDGTQVLVIENYTTQLGLRFNRGVRTYDAFYRLVQNLSIDNLVDSYRPDFLTSLRTTYWASSETTPTFTVMFLKNNKMAKKTIRLDAELQGIAINNEGVILKTDALNGVFIPKAQVGIR